MVDDKIKQIGSRIFLVDPNDFNGQNSSSNFSVPLEDLSIYAQLEVINKDRTIISPGEVQNIQGETIQFIKGSQVNNQSVLTTNYTDLTTDYSKDNIKINNETFGITSIDIDFSTSFAPMIVINFIDVRGNTLFQPQENNKAKGGIHTAFFKLPYPMFKLTIKGFYGNPVSYDLHLTKFTSKFNSQTGNFEITGTFIGYTYAMLSDMLLGYLRAIPYTRKGAELYIEKNVKTLDDVIDVISKIDEKLLKLKQSNPLFNKISVLELKIQTLENIKNVLINLASTLNGNDTNPDNTVFNYFLDKVGYDEKIKTYNKTVKDIVTSFNQKFTGDEELKLNEKDFILTTDFRKSINDAQGEAKNYLTTVGAFNSDSNYGVYYDLTSIYKTIDDYINTSTNDEKTSKISLSDEIRNTIKREFDFDLNIKNIIEVFTTAVDVFVETLFDVSRTAFNSEPRKKELKKITDSKSLDFKNNDVYYPWPEYRVKDKNNVYTEKFLGDKDVPIVSTNVTELNFVDELLYAFLISGKRNRNAENQTTQIWSSVNPLDTKFFFKETPYSRINGNSIEEVIGSAVMRGVIYLGYSNWFLTNPEITEKAKLEAQEIIKYILNENILRGIQFKKKDTFLSSEAILNDIKKKIITSNGGNIYEYTLKETNESFLPLYGGENKDFSFTFNYGDTNSLIGKVINEEKYFLSNYVYSESTNPRVDDGGIYIKWITDYQSTGNQTPIDFDELNKAFREYDVKKAGFDNSGTYGVQEFKKIKIIEKKIENGEFRISFYGGTNSLNGFCKKSSVNVNYDLGKSLNTPLITIFSDISKPATSEVNGYINKKRGDSLNKNIELTNAYLSSNDNDIRFPYIDIMGGFGFVTEFTKKVILNIRISLFGSKLYYAQNSKEAKAYLFLNTLPFNKNEFGRFDLTNNTFLLNVFANRSGFISIPKVWGAYIGAILWRNEFNIDPIIFSSSTVSLIPNTVEPFYAKQTDNILKKLPEQAKTEFKNIFYDFVINEFEELRKELELCPDCTFSEWLTKYSEVTTNNYFTSTNLDIVAGSDWVEKLNTEYTNAKNYSLINFYYDKPELTGNFVLEIDDNQPIATRLVQILTNEIFIANTSIAIWDIESYKNSEVFRQNIQIREDWLNTYLDTLVNELGKIGETINNQKKQIENEYFGTDNENLIKFQLYKTCKNIYDKWIGNVKDKNAVIYSNTPKNTLIDSFKFINSAFVDIGNDFYVNPTPILSYLKYNPNSSFYACVTHFLSSNNFDFIALPNFINYNDPKKLASLFQPVRTNQISNALIDGPAFVCVYVGQPSKSLDFNDSKYPNDGFDIRQGPDETKIREDYTNNNKDKVAVFCVNYGQQNQNIFKNISLDQNEFSETAESLQIIDEIANKGAETKGTYVGQNIYNVYSVRSYKTEVEMMGNAMIQPMMHFQLNNIPMFHGAYLIIKAKHSIKANTMTTTFTGVRIRNINTPLIEASDLYMSLLDSLTAKNGQTNNQPINLGGVFGGSDRPPKPELKCGILTKNTTNFDSILKLIIQYLEGAYCNGVDCGSSNSGETLWGIDRKNFKPSKANEKNFNDFWTLIEKNKTSKWGQSYPKNPNEKGIDEIYKVYLNLVQQFYTEYKNTYTNIDNKKLIPIIESDGRLYLNMVYAAFNGPGYFQKFYEFLVGKNTTNADELLQFFVDERVNGASTIYPNFSNSAKLLIARTGVDIQKMVGLGPYCTSA